MSRYITDDIKISSDDFYTDDSEQDSDEGNSNEENKFHKSRLYRIIASTL